MDAKEPEYAAVWRRELGQTVRAWMAARRLRPVHLLKQTAIGKNTFYRLVDGTGESSMETLRRVAQALDVSVSDLLAFRQPPKSDAQRPSGMEAAVASATRNLGGQQTVAALDARLSGRLSKIDGELRRLDSLDEDLDQVISLLDLLGGAVVAIDGVPEDLRAQLQKALAELRRSGDA